MSKKKDVVPQEVKDVVTAVVPEVGTEAEDENDYDETLGHTNMWLYFRALF